MAINMKSAVIGRTIIAYHTQLAPSNKEWNEFCDLIRFNGATCNGVIAYSLGGGPSAIQRKESIAAWRSVKKSMDRFPKLAIVSPSRLVTGVGRAFVWVIGSDLETKFFNTRTDDNAVSNAAEFVGAMDVNAVVTEFKLFERELDHEVG